MPAHWGLFVRDQETPVRIGMRGGAGRTLTSSQTVMSGPLWLRTERIFPAYGPRGLKLPVERVSGAARYGVPKGAPESPLMNRNVVRGLNICAPFGLLILDWTSRSGRACMRCREDRWSRSPCRPGSCRPRSTTPRRPISRYDGAWAVAATNEEEPQWARATTGR